MMIRLPLVLIAVLASALRPLQADDKAPEVGPSAAVSTAYGKKLERVLQSPNDLKILQAFLRAASQEAAYLTHYYGDYAAAERSLTQWSTALDQLKPTDAEVQAELERARKQIASRQAQLVALPKPLADLEKEFLARPNDYSAYMAWHGRALSEYMRLSYRDPDAAKRQQEATRAFCERVARITRDDKVANGLRVAGGLVGGFGGRGGVPMEDPRIAAGRALAAQIGQEPRPLPDLKWIRGGPVVLADLKGQVVLLNHWKISTYCEGIIPFLRQWQDRYAGKGLVLVSIASVRSIRWDDSEHELVFMSYFDPLRVPLVVPNAIEGEDAVRKLVAYHNLDHRLALVQEEAGFLNRDPVAEQGGLTVIDRAGKVRLIRVRPVDKENREVAALLAELLAAPAK